MRKCRALVKCGRGCSYVSGILDTSTLLPLLHTYIHDVTKTLLQKMHDDWDRRAFGKSPEDSLHGPRSLCSSFTAHSSLRTTKRTTGWTYVQLAGTNETALWTIGCCQFLRFTILNLSSCITVTFICPA